MNRISKSLVIGVVLLLALAVVPAALADHTDPEGYEGTQVHRYEHEFGHWECIPATDWWADIPAYFAEREGRDVDVCVFYEGLWTETLIVKESAIPENDFGDVRWSANIVGTATFYEDEDGDDTWGCGSAERQETQPPHMTGCTEVLTVAKWKQEEVGRDIDGDAECLFLAEPTYFFYGAAQAESDSCWLNWGVGGGDDLYREGKLEFLNLQQKTTFDDEVVIYMHLAIHGFYPEDEGGKIYTKWCAWSDMVSMGTYCFEE